MNDFIFHNPAKVDFGKNQIEFISKPNLNANLQKLGVLTQEKGTFVLKLPKTDDILSQIEQLINNS